MIFTCGVHPHSLLGVVKLACRSFHDSPSQIVHRPIVVALFFSFFQRFCSFMLTASKVFVFKSNTASGKGKAAGKTLSSRAAVYLSPPSLAWLWNVGGRGKILKFLRSNRECCLSLDGDLSPLRRARISDLAGGYMIVGNDQSLV